ncbi:LCP family protein [Bacillus kwashiorkori]|uniref:LCP family glycopolymer transferase n=1 Tax=Bacillus kwashiorkori TaxID=1522318 RepID=UPI000785CD3E|nr:LCP family protein [Bacillus kwashiorkori]
MRTDKLENKKKKKRRYKIFFIILAVFLLGLGGYLYSIFHSANKALDAMHTPINKSEKREKEISLKEKHPFSVLLLGVDQRKNDRGRSDTMIVVTVNPNENVMKMLSIPRDTYVDIVGRGTKDKINHAYAFGGVSMSLKTVEEFLDIPIDYYVQVNMEGFKDIVDAVNGVTIKNDMHLTYGGYTFPEGELNLNGKEALTFVRIRKEDPRGDFGRQLRQKLVIQAILNKGASISSLWNYSDIFNALGDNVKTNLTFNEMVNLQKNYKGVQNNIEQLQFKNGKGGYIGKVWYYFADEGELADFQELLKEQLEIS